MKGLKKESMGEKDFFSKYGLVFVSAIVALVIFNQYQISGISNLFTGATIKSGNFNKDTSDFNVNNLKSTGHSVAALFPVENIKTTQDAVNIMIPTGIPEYGNALGVSFDDPIGSLDFLSKSYNQIKNDVKKNNPDVWQRYLNLATKPVGISCEYCCGVGPIGITNNGELRCGCQHNPALQAITLWLMKNTDYSDAEVLTEALRWKALWFPKNVVNLALTVAGGDSSALEDLPGMVGGC